MTEEQQGQLKSYLQSGKHLPKFLRDFHDQKDVFKCVGNAGDSNGNDPYAVNWMQGQIYTVDRFLWFMAVHGYELQRTRKKLPHKDLETTVKTRKEEDARVFREYLHRTTESEKPPTGT